MALNDNADWECPPGPLGPWYATAVRWDTTPFEQAQDRLVSATETRWTSSRGQIIGYSLEHAREDGLWPQALLHPGAPSEKPGYR